MNRQSEESGGEWYPEILEFIESAVGAARSGNETATRHLLAFFAKCLRRQVPPPEPLASYVADEIDRQILPPSERPGIDLLGAMLGSPRGRGRPTHSPAVELARTLAVEVEMMRRGVGVTQARQIVSDRFDNGSGKDMTRTLERAEEKTRTKAEASAARLKEWVERLEAKREADLKEWEAAGRPGCISVVLSREYGCWLAGETIRVDPTRATWLQENGYAAQILGTAAEAAAASECYRERRAFARANQLEGAPQLAWGDELGEIVIEHDPIQRQ